MDTVFARITKLAKAELALDDLGIGLSNLSLVAEVALALLALLGHDVALERLGAHELARTGLADALGHTAMGLHLGH